jgi:hypothetical protein
MKTYPDTGEPNINCVCLKDGYLVEEEIIVAKNHVLRPGVSLSS